MKTPEEIKKGLMCGSSFCNIACPYWNDDSCTIKVNEDALAYIQQLEADLKQEKADHQHTYECAEAFQKENAELLEKIKHLEQEQDAAVRALRKTSGCLSCKHEAKTSDEQPCMSCGIAMKNYEWRGSCNENGGEL